MEVRFRFRFGFINRSVNLRVWVSER
jgi:hypothetical protein